MRFAGLPVIGLIGAVVLSLAAATPGQAVEFRAAERVDLAGDFSDTVFASGRDVSLALTTTDDVFAAGRDLRARDVRADHLALAGRAIRFDSGEVKDILAFGAEIALDGGQALDDVIAAGGELRLGRGFRVGGSAVVGGGEVTIEAPVGGDLRAGGETVRIDGPVAGRVEVHAERLVIGPNARIGGDLVYAAGKAEISPAAVVTGRKVARPYEAARRPARADLAEEVAGRVIAAGLICVLGGSLLTLVAASLFPALMRGAAGRIESRPLAAVGVGFLVMVAPLPLAVLLAVTVVGVPLALATLLLALALAPLALAVPVYWLAMRARGLVARGREPTAAGGLAVFGWSLLATAALCLLGAIPVVGGFVWLAAYLFGLGALAMEGRRLLAAES